MMIFVFCKKVGSLTPKTDAHPTNIRLGPPKMIRISFRSYLRQSVLSGKYSDFIKIFNFVFSFNRFKTGLDSLIRSVRIDG